MSLLTVIEKYISTIEPEFSLIPKERKQQLLEFSSYIRSRNSLNEPVNLIFICTHNSRRSHMSQLWAQTAAYYYGKTTVHCFSGGTEATSFNPRSVRALRKAGFEIIQTDHGANPFYEVRFAEEMEPLRTFSKRTEDDANPKSDFIAVMTCSDADEACPLVPGAAHRVAITYEDPKAADDTPEEEGRYNERCRQIAVEMFFVFSQV